MAKTKISEFDVDPANNTDINSINIAEGCAPSGINNAIRQLMSDLKEFQTGAGGDPFNGAVNGTVGATTPASGAFTSLSASGAFSANGGATLGDASGDALTINSSAVSIPNGLNFDSNTFVIDATNNTVGIGTSSPANTFVVGGSSPQIQVSGSGTSTDFRINAAYGSAAVAAVGTVGAHPMFFFTNNAERMRIDSSGNVGIGTSSPASKLSVTNAFSHFDFGGDRISGNARNFTLVRQGTGLGNQSALSSVIFGGSHDGTTFNPAVSINAFAAGGFSSTSSPGYLTFNTTAVGSISPTERLRIDSSGNLGIGTSSPNASAILDVQSTTKGVRMPNMTTTQKNAIASPAAGLMVFDTTLAKLCVYSGSAWQTITSI